MKRFGIGVLSIFAWLSLFIAILSTTVLFTMSGINNVGTIATNSLKDFSSSPSTINAFIDQLKLNADPKMIKSLDQNRAALNATIASVSGSAEFQAALKKELDVVTAGISSGASSVSVNFKDLANLVASQVNKAAKTQIVTEADLASMKRQTIDIHKQSDIVNKIKHYAHLGSYMWGLWLLLLLACWALKAKSVVSKSGKQLLSVGLMSIIIRFVVPFVISQRIASSTFSQFAYSQIGSVAGVLLKPILTTGITFSVLGITLSLIAKFAGKGKKQEVAIS